MDPPPPPLSIFPSLSRLNFCFCLLEEVDLWGYPVLYCLFICGSETAVVSKVKQFLTPWCILAAFSCKIVLVRHVSYVRHHTFTLTQANPKLVLYFASQERQARYRAHGGPRTGLSCRQASGSASAVGIPGPTGQRVLIPVRGIFRASKFFASNTECTISDTKKPFKRKTFLQIFQFHPICVSELQESENLAAQYNALF